MVITNYGYYSHGYNYHSYDNHSDNALASMKPHLWAKYIALACFVCLWNKPYMPFDFIQIDWNDSRTVTTKHLFVQLLFQLEESASSFANKMRLCKKKSQSFEF